MDPYQQQPSGLQPPQTNPYEFILNPQKPPKRKGMTGGMTGIILLVVGGAVVVMIVLAVVVSLLGGGKKSVAEELVGITQTQNELIRVANAGTSGSVQQTTRNLAVTTEYALRTQQNETILFLAANGRELSDKEATLKQNARTDQQLRLAKSTSTFDLVFSQIMQNHLTEYASSLKQVFSNTKNDKTRSMLSEYYEQTQLLISQVPYTQESIENASQ